jgi:hypothetical protein
LFVKSSHQSSRFSYDFPFCNPSAFDNV